MIAKKLVSTYFLSADADNTAVRLTADHRTPSWVKKFVVAYGDEPQSGHTRTRDRDTGHWTVAGQLWHYDRDLLFKNKKRGLTPP